MADPPLTNFRAAQAALKRCTILSSQPTRHIGNKPFKTTFHSLIKASHALPIFSNLHHLLHSHPIKLYIIIAVSCTNNTGKKDQPHDRSHLLYPPSSDSSTGARPCTAAARQGRGHRRRRCCWSRVSAGSDESRSRPIGGLQSFEKYAELRAKSATRWQKICGLEGWCYCTDRWAVVIMKELRDSVMGFERNDKCVLWTNLWIIRNRCNEEFSTFTIGKLKKWRTTHRSLRNRKQARETEITKYATSTEEEEEEAKAESEKTGRFRWTRKTRIHREYL